MTDQQATILRNQAERLLSHHDYDHGKQRDSLNCGACALSLKTPNYSGWLRIYIQAGKPVDRNAYKKEMERAEKENDAYFQAINEDIAYFGISFR